MKLLMPNITDELTLDQDFAFELHLKENPDAWNILVEEVKGGRWNHYNSTEKRNVTLPKGTKLRVIWYYMAKGNPNATRVSFSMQRPDDKKKTKLELRVPDVNRMDVEVKNNKPLPRIEWDYIRTPYNDTVTANDNNFPKEISVNPPVVLGTKVNCKVNGKNKYYADAIVARRKLVNSFRTNSGFTAYYKPVPQYQLYDSSGNSVGEPATTFETIKTRVKKLETDNEE